MPVVPTPTIPSTKTLSFALKGFTENPRGGVGILHVYEDPAFEVTFVILIPLVLLIVLKTTPEDGKPFGISTTSTDRILFSNIMGSKNPLFISSPVLSLITMISGAVI